MFDACKHCTEVGFSFRFHILMYMSKCPPVCEASVLPLQSKERESMQSVGLVERVGYAFYPIPDS